MPMSPAVIRWSILNWTAPPSPQRRCNAVEVSTTMVRAAWGGRGVGGLCTLFGGTLATVATDRYHGPMRRSDGHIWYRYLPR